MDDDVIIQEWIDGGDGRYTHVCKKCNVYFAGAYVGEECVVFELGTSVSEARHNLAWRLHSG